MLSSDCDFPLTGRRIPWASAIIVNTASTSLGGFGAQVPHASMVNSGAAPTSTIAIALINSGSLALLLSATCQKAVRNLPRLCTQETAFSARRISPIG
jgi:hypothetical protein